MAAPLSAAEGRVAAARTTLLHGHTRRVLSLAWNAAGTVLASGGADGTIRLWNVDATGQVCVRACVWWARLQWTWALIAVGFDCRAAQCAWAL